MTIVYEDRSRQLSGFGPKAPMTMAPISTGEGYYPQPAQNPQYGYYRQQSPPVGGTHPQQHATLAPQPSHVALAPHPAHGAQYPYMNREMELFGTSGDYRMYPPSPPVQNTQIVPFQPQVQFQYPGYMRAAPQEMYQPMDQIPRLAVPSSSVISAPIAAPIPGPISHTFSRIPSPFTHHEGMHPATQRRHSNTLPGLRKAGKRTHSCMVCGKVFARPSALQTHLYSHTGEKPFRCEQEGCGRSFSVVSNLRRHARVHKS